MSMSECRTDNSSKGLRAFLTKHSFTERRDCCAMYKKKLLVKTKIDLYIETKMYLWSIKLSQSLD